MRRDGFEFIKQNALREQLRKSDGRFARRIEHVEWDTRPAKLFQNFCDRRIGVGPIGFQFHDAVALKGVTHGGGFEHGCFVKFASDTPGGREIDEDGMTLGQFRLQTLRGEWLPVAVRLRVGWRRVERHEIFGR